MMTFEFYLEQELRKLGDTPLTANIMADCMARASEAQQKVEREIDMNFDPNWD